MVLERTSERLSPIGLDVKFIVYEVLRTLGAVKSPGPWVEPLSGFRHEGTCLCALPVESYTDPRGQV